MTAHSPAQSVCLATRRVGALANNHSNWHGVAACRHVAAFLCHHHEAKVTRKQSGLLKKRSKWLIPQSQDAQDKSASLNHQAFPFPSAVFLPHQLQDDFLAGLA